MATEELKDDLTGVASAREAPPAAGLSRSKIPSWLKGAGQIVLGAAALIYIISKSDSHELVRTLRATRLWYMPLAVAATLVVYWLMAFRWKLILAARGYRP